MQFSAAVYSKTFQGVSDEQCIREVGGCLKASERGGIISPQITLIPARAACNCDDIFERCLLAHMLYS